MLPQAKHTFSRFVRLVFSPVPFFGLRNLDLCRDRVDPPSPLWSLGSALWCSLWGTELDRSWSPVWAGEIDFFLKTWRLQGQNYLTKQKKILRVEGEDGFGDIWDNCWVLDYWIRFLIPHKCFLSLGFACCVLSSKDRRSSLNPWKDCLSVFLLQCQKYSWPSSPHTMCVQQTEVASEKHGPSQWQPDSDEATSRRIWSQ